MSAHTLTAPVQSPRMPPAGLLASAGAHQPRRQDVLKWVEHLLHQESQRSALEQDVDLSPSLEFGASEPHRPAALEDHLADTSAQDRVAVIAKWLGVDIEQEAQAPAAAGDPGLPKWRLKKVIAYIDENISETISLVDLADCAGLSRMYFAAQFRSATGYRPHEYVLRKRVLRAQELLREKGASLVQVALSVGFRTQAHFTTVFKQLVGATPHHWRSVNGPAA